MSDKKTSWFPTHTISVQFLEDHNGKALVRLPNGSKTSLHYEDLTPDPDYQPNFKPDWCSPPGNSVFSCLEHKRMSVQVFAYRMDKSDEWCQRLISGEEPITEEVAQKLADTIGGSYNFWMNRERQYRNCLKRQAVQERLSKQ